MAIKLEITIRKEGLLYMGFILLSTAAITSYFPR